jgi:Mrp family chromosome partitioning ATPase
MPRPIVETRQFQSFAEAVRAVQHAAGLTPNRRNAATDPALAIGVTSTRVHDGKTTFAMGLAGSLAEDLGVDVTLVDADFHTHSIGEEYGLTGRRGLSDVLRGSAEPDAVAHRLPRGTLRIIPAGATLEDSARIARSQFAAQFVENMKTTNRFVVFDLPTATSSTTAPVLARLLDGVIVVVRAGRTTRQELDQALQRMRGANILGVVLNDWSTKIPRLLEHSLGLKS